MAKVNWDDIEKGEREVVTMPISDRLLSVEMLSKRERFAMAAMEGMAERCKEEGGERAIAYLVARQSVKYADALLKELERTTNE